MCSMCLQDTKHEIMAAFYISNLYEHKNGKVLISASEIQLNTEVFHVTSMTP